MIEYGLLIARLCLAAVFLYSGADKLWHWRSSIEEVKGDGLPWPAAFAGATVFTQLVGGCLSPRVSSHGWARCCSPALLLRPRCSGTASASAAEPSSGTN
jgi:hypothetical protein